MIPVGQEAPSSHRIASACGVELTAIASAPSVPRGSAPFECDRTLCQSPEALRRARNPRIRACAIQNRAIILKTSLSPSWLWHSYLDMGGAALTIRTRCAVRALLLVILLAAERTHALVGAQEPTAANHGLELRLRVYSMRSAHRSKLVMQASWNMCEQLRITCSATPNGSRQIEHG